MRRFLSCLLLTLALPAAWGQNELRLDTLPAHNVSGTQGVSAPFTGRVDGKLLVAGGCNFPDTPAADGGAKVFYDQVWQLDGDEWQTLPDVRLPRPTAYGAYVSTSG